MKAAPASDHCHAADRLAALVRHAPLVEIYDRFNAQRGRQTDAFVAGVVGAMKLVEELGPEATVVTVLCDSNKKYLSTALPQAEPPQDDYMTPQVQLQSFISVR